MKLSNSFTLSEMLKSNTASRLGIEEQFNPNKEIINNLIDRVLSDREKAIKQMNKRSNHANKENK